jgi:pyruvate/2-oxoglutarate dehydrogenase complex dihydrolipoamide acyltransferase (E2) component
VLTRIKMPKLAETTDTVVIDEWLVAVDDHVSVGQVLASVATDKVNVELPSPVAGTIRNFLVEAGDDVKTGDQICVIEN